MRVFSGLFLAAVLAAAPLSAQSLTSVTPEAAPGVSQSVVVLGTTPLAPEAGASVQSAAASREVPATRLYVDEGPNSGTVLVMALGGAIAAGSFAAGTAESNNQWAFWLTPLVGGATTYALGEIMGHRGQPVRALGATALGALPGAAVLALTAARADGESIGSIGADDVVLFLAGYGLYVAVPPALAARMHHVAPAVHTTPDGQSVPGLSLRIGL